jgi:hypothetical protein
MKNGCEEMTQEVKKKLDSMSHVQLVSLWRFGKSSNPLFHGEAGAYLRKRIESLGGFGPVSKQVGW